MELVYLWVEDYKNIYKQGFNFSPRFECEYKDEKLTICDKQEKDNKCKNKDYIENFFGDNINVTAIVGKNGSGKSSVIEYIEKIMIQEPIKDYIYILFSDEIIYINTHIKSKLKIIMLNTKIKYKLDDTHKFSLCTYYAEMPYPYEYREKLHNQNKFFTVNMQEKNIYKSIASLLKRNKNEVLNNLDFIFKPSSIEIDENAQYRKNLVKNIFNQLNENISFDDYEIKDSLLKESFVLTQNQLLDNLIYEFYDNQGIYDDYLYSKSDEEFEKNKNIYRKSWMNSDGLSISDEEIKEELIEIKMKEYPPEEYITNTLNKDKVYQYFLTQLNLIFYDLFFKKISINIDIFKIFLLHQIVKNNLIENYFEFIISNFFKYYESIETLEMLVEKIFEDSEINKIENFLYTSKIIININYKNYKELKPNYINQSNVNEYFGDYYKFFIFDFLDINKRRFSYLSYGEKTFYGLIINIYTYILEDSTHNSLLLCFDEPELSLHPKWQKEFLNKLFFVLRNTIKNIHLVFTSHSPFLLSDIPKQNIIFLDTDEKGICQVVDGLIDKKQTFGANIHTLLSDSFFMDDGLMGEFAKGKIDDLISYLNDGKSTIKDNDEAQKLLNIIGEPIIKNQLQRMLDSKRLKKVDEIDDIKKKMIEMQQRLYELEK